MPLQGKEEDIRPRPCWVDTELMKAITLRQ